MKLEEEYFTLTAKKRELTQQLEDVKKDLACVEESLLLWLEDNDLEQIKGEYGTIFTRTDYYARITDEPTAFKWLEENDMGDIIKRTVNSKTLSSVVRDRGEFPGIETSLVTKIGFRSKK